MELGILGRYIICINILGFALFALNMLLYHRAYGRQIEGVLVAAAVLGGALGMGIAMLLLDRRPVKEAMLTRVVALCALIVQIVLLLLFHGGFGQGLDLHFIRFLAQRKWFLYYYLAINVVTFAAFGIDKRAAEVGGQRIPIVTLLGLSLIGGAVGGMLAMQLFRHKTQVSYFTAGLPMMLIAQAALLLLWMNL